MQQIYQKKLTDQITKNIGIKNKETGLKECLYIIHLTITLNKILKLE